MFSSANKVDECLKLIKSEELKIWIYWVQYEINHKICHENKKGPNGVHVSNRMELELGLLINGYN